MRRVGDTGVGKLVEADSCGLISVTEIDRGGLTEDVEVVLKESGNLSLAELRSGGGIGLDDNLLVVIDLARGGSTGGGGADSRSFFGEVRDGFLDLTIVKGCGVRSMLPFLSLLANFHSSSQAGIMWSTHSHPSGL